MFNANKNVYSFSKLSTIENCPYEAYLTYIERERGADSVYGILGGRVHDKLEDIINGKAEKADLKQALEQDLEQLELLDLHFPKDYKGGDSIRDNWVADMTHFVENFEPPEGDFKTEEFILYKVDDDHYIQGYADLVRYDSEDGKVQSILDWKTSSMYSGDDIKHHGRQLVIYALAKEQEGIEINEIAWIFLKYVTVTFMGKKRANSKTKTEMSKNVSRRKIIEELDKYIRDDLVDAGYDDIDIEMYMMQAKDLNTFDVLPDEVKSNYKVEPCIVRYELTNEVKDECKEFINDMMTFFEKDDDEKWVPKSFYKETKFGKREDTFFCNFLCGHRKTCKHLLKFNEEKLLKERELEEFL